jgi:hypothetical protein
MEVVFEREVLFREVWESPISALAKKYGLSDQGLRKVCLALSIPLPGRGHWAKVAAGHKIPTPALPPTSGATKFRSLPPLPSPSHDVWEDRVPWLKGRLAFESDPANEIVVAPGLSKPHRLVKETVRAVRDEIAGFRRSRAARSKQHGDPNWAALQRPNWAEYERRGQLMEMEQNVLPMRVSIEASDRALRIWDALIRAFEARGMQVSIAGHMLRVCFDGEDVGVRLSEKVREETPSSAPLRAKTRLPTGVLRIFVIDRGERKFEDSPEQPLERQLNAVLQCMFRSIASLRVARQMRAEQERLNSERSRQALQAKRAAAEAQPKEAEQACSEFAAKPATRVAQPSPIGRDQSRSGRPDSQRLEEIRRVVDQVANAIVDALSGTTAPSRSPLSAKSGANGGMDVDPAPYVTVKLAAQLTGLSEKAIRRKIEEGKWLDGREYRRSPDGGVFISIKGYSAWVEGGRR